MKRIFYVVMVLFFMTYQPLNASHVLGGEMSYKCLGGGIYEFTVVLFRDCNGIGWDQTSLIIQHNVPALPPINCVRLPGAQGVVDVTQRCPGNTTFSCGASPTTSPGPTGSVAMQVFRGTINLSSAPPPPAVGYVFTMNDIRVNNNPSNFRNTNNNNTASFQAMTLRVIMLPYTNPSTGLTLTPSQMCDNSPVFAEPPVALQIVNPFDTVTFNNFAFDNDLDSLSFHVDVPWIGVFQPGFYNNGFSITNPWPGIIPVPTPTGNVAIDPAGGVITFRPTTSGNWLACIRVDAWRCGQRIASIFRDFQMQIINAPIGSAPPYNPNAPSPFQQRAPEIDGYLIDQATGRVRYDLTYYSGDTVIIPIQARDNFPFFRGSESNPIFRPDTMFVTFSGLPLSTTNNPAANCPFPPCMTIRGINDPNPPAPVINAPAPLLVRRNTSDTTTRFLGIGYRGILEVGAKLVWFPSCNNIPENSISGQAFGCATTIASNQVSITALDDNCPVQGKTTVTYTFRVKALPVLPAPFFYGVSVDSTNRGATLYFHLDYDSVTVDPLDTINFFGYNRNTDFLLARAKSVARRRASFEKYRIYRSTTRNGPYVLYDSISVIDTYSWRDNNVNLNNNEYYYYITTVSGCGAQESRPTDTLKTISFSLNNNILLGRAELRWDSTAEVHNRGYFPNATGKYLIQRAMGTSVSASWANIDSVIDLYTYIQSVSVCNDSLFYRVGLVDTNGRAYWSMIDGDLFRDIYPPDSILIHHVSVDSISGLPLLSWQAGPSTDIVAYVVYRMNISTNPPVATLIDTVRGYNNTYWLDNVSGQDPSLNSLHYGIAGFDSCGNLGLISRRHSTISLQGGLDQCISSIVLNWNAYVGWDAVDNYEVYRSASGSAWTLLATIPANGSNFEYTDNTNLITDSTYCYSIVATRGVDDTVAVSNRLCEIARVIREPEYTYIRQVTVDSTLSLIKVLFAVDSAADAGNFELYRSTAASDFRKIAEFGPAAMTLNGGFREYEFIDETADPSKEIYYYRVYAYDLCDQLFDTSNTSNSIFLQATPEVDFFNRMRWNSYASWLGGVERYEILRLIPDVDVQFLPLNRLGANSVVYADDINNFTDNDGRYRYVVVAFEGAGNTAGFSDLSMSNIVEVVQQPRVFMPTAFMPLGVNRMIFPKGVFIEERVGYSIEIYNRWGEAVFRSTNIAVGWDGRHSATGEYVEPGVYAFVLNFIGKNGKVYSQNGTFTVIR